MSESYRKAIDQSIAEKQPVHLATAMILSRAELILCAQWDGKSKIYPYPEGRNAVEIVGWPEDGSEDKPEWTVILHEI